MALTNEPTPGQNAGAPPAGPAAPRARVSRSQQIADHLAGEAGEFERDLTPYLPQDIIGGSVPYVPGTEDEAVWNAASQACATERVHYCYSVEDDRIWYLACPSSSLSSNPNSWCPLAAALPGNSEYWDRETVYLYEQEGVAAALRWDPETGRMQVYVGASRTILPRIQTMDANFVTINPDVSDIVAWRNRALRTEKLSRATARMLIYVGLMINFVAIIILGVQHAMMFMVERDLSAVQRETQMAVDGLMLDAATTMQSDTIRHMVRIQELLDGLAKIDGTLVRYEVDGDNVEWEALVPQVFKEGAGTIRGEIQPGIEPDGRVRILGRR